VVRSPTLEKKACESAPVSKPPDAVNGLVRRLVRKLEKNVFAMGTAKEEVLLDVQVDGVRCLLTRVPRDAARPSVILSPREREIARMVARGYPNKTIAGVLDISSWTVGTYLRRVFAKLNIGSHAAMVARLMEEGLLKDSM
jgi:DNA-binding CsgD family transcriptional regulator